VSAQRKGVCPLCRHNEVISSPSFAERAISHDAQAARVYGMLTLFTCRRCGFSQWFANRPDEVPIDQKRGIELISGPEPEGPYR
jgi:hypothetical protein